MKFLKTLINKDTIESMIIGAKYIFATALCVILIAYLSNEFPILFKWLYITFIVTAGLSFFSYMVGDVVKSSSGYKEKQKKKLN